MAEIVVVLMTEDVDSTYLGSDNNLVSLFR